MKQIDDIKEIQKVLFDALCYFDSVCRREGITYYLSNGTLLGAVKYGAFIPWDDDVDVVLPREDYQRLVSLAEVSNGEYRLLCKEQVPTWRMPYAKLSCERTALVEGQYDFGAAFGLSVDIFPLDAWHPCRPFARCEAFLSDVRKRMLVCAIGGDFKTNKTGLKKFILKSIWRRGKRLGYARVLQKIEASVARAQKRKPTYIGCLAWCCHRENEVLPATLFQTVQEVSFCGRTFPVFSGYTSYLDSLYGNWRRELPPEQQHSNHEIKVWWKDAD